MAQTVAQLIAELQKQDPKAIALWRPTGSCVAHAIETGIQVARVRQIDDGHGMFSMIGAPEERKIKAILIDAEGS